VDEQLSRLIDRRQQGTVNAVRKTFWDNGCDVGDEDDNGRRPILGWGKWKPGESMTTAFATKLGGYHGEPRAEIVRFVVPLGTDVAERDGEQPSSNADALGTVGTAADAVDLDDDDRRMSRR
jgi:hypothetical protein